MDVDAVVAAAVDSVGAVVDSVVGASVVVVVVVAVVDSVVGAAVVVDTGGGVDGIALHDRASFASVNPLLQEQV